MSDRGSSRLGRRIGLGSEGEDSGQSNTVVAMIGRLFGNHSVVLEHHFLTTLQLLGVVDDLGLVHADLGLSFCSGFLESIHSFTTLLDASTQRRNDALHTELL